MSNRPTTRRSASARFAAPAGSTEATRSRRTMWILVAVAAAVVVALVVAVVATAANKSTGGESVASGATIVPGGDLSSGSVHVDGPSLAPFTGTASDPAAGQAAPRVEGQQFDGSSIQFPVQGQPAVIVFLAHWCPHCQKEVPLLAKWLGQNGLPTDVGLYAVATGNDRKRPNFPPGDWLRRERWPVPTMVDDSSGTAGSAYGLSGFPYFVAIGPEGKVVQRASGELTVEQFQSLMDAARNGQPSSGLSNPGPASNR